MVSENKQSKDSGIVKNLYIDIFSNTIADFMKKNEDPSACPSEIIRNGERKWKSLPKCKKLEFIMKKLKPGCRCQRSKYAPKKRKKCEPMCEQEQMDMEENMDSDFFLDENMDETFLVDGCCPPKKRKRRKPCCPPRKRRKPNPCCPKKRKPRCPKKRKPRCPKKRKPRCPC